MPHPLALATSDANADASTDANQTQMATMAEQHYLHPEGATPMTTQATQMPPTPTVTYSKKWSITASGHTNVSALLNNNIINDSVSVTSESAHCPCRCNPHPHGHPGGRGGHSQGRGMWPAVSCVTCMSVNVYPWGRSSSHVETGPQNTHGFVLASVSNMHQNKCDDE